MKSLILLAVLLAVLDGRAEITNLVVNGSFASDQLHPGVPDFWQAAGNSAIHQELRRDLGRDSGYSARLDCTEFSGDGGDYHAMLCQLGKVSVRRGQWYQLSFWSKAANLKAGAIELGLSDTRDWQTVGLSEAFAPGAQWERFEFRFQAQQDLPASASRLQFYHRNTGTFWLADVVLAPIAEGREWFPQIPIEGVKNFIPNSSFECGAANWGSYTYGLHGWAGNLYRLEGSVDAATAEHGSHCLKIALGPGSQPVFYFDYYEPVRQPVRRVLAANRGWFHVKPGEPLTLSAFLRGEAEGLVGQLAVIEAPDHLQGRQASVSTHWQRYEYTFTPTQPFLFIAVGLDLEASSRDAGTLWVDAVQLEHGKQATAYEPRTPVESFLESPAPGNLFTNLSTGTEFQLRAFNDSDQPQTLAGRLTVTDFFDQNVCDRQPTLTLPPRSAVARWLTNLVPDRRGFFRVNWTTTAASQMLRCAVVTKERLDSPFGFNHMYPWDFLVDLAGQAGVHWWRDWSAQWQTVEAQPGQFDFRASDAQIYRALSRTDDQVDVLLPFPSAAWSTSARPEEVAKAAGDNRELRTRLPVAYAPTNLADFGSYAAAVVRHYPRHAVFQVLNEPVYTDYALPQKFGYTVDDYVRLLEVAAHAMKKARPDCQIVGGLSAGVQTGWTRDFVTKGGLEFLDVF
ncbi:MAG TPA: carbohydrate binding domain-containing protein, partial [Candidatus Acidoferrales bacterium]|nr:carbohydrate binding domain-containing protein [Candidatus Acidoferrales bacterium]